MLDQIFIQISLLLGITVAISFLTRLLRQPLIIGYIIAGLIVGPVFLNTLDGSEEVFNIFAEFGIVLLLFVVGLSLNFNYFKKIGKVILVAGLIQFVITASIGFLMMTLMGFSVISSAFVAVAITFSSTIIVVKLLTDKEDLETVYGKFIIGLLLVQDMIVVGLMIFLNNPGTHAGMWYDALLLTIGKGLILILGVFILARFILPKLLDIIANSAEFLFIFTLAWCFGIAGLVYWAGFSIEIGAVVAGISLGTSKYQREISSRIKSLRDFFIVLFFIVLGAELQIADIANVLVPGIILSAFVLIADPLILYFVMRRMKYTRRNAFLAGVTAAQISEFGFILAFKGREIGYLNGTEIAIITVIALITITVSSYLIEYNEHIYRRLLPLLNKLGKETEEDKEEKQKHVYDVWVFGYHRIGWKVCETLQQMKIKYAVIDFNPSAISKLKRREIPAYFGDAADVEFLDSLPLEKSKMIISTLPEADDQITMIEHVRKKSKKPTIIANLYHSDHLDDLYHAGANYVMMPHLLGGGWISEVLKSEAWTKKTFAKLKKDQKEEMKLRFTTGVGGV